MNTLLDTYDFGSGAQWQLNARDGFFILKMPADHLQALRTSVLEGNLRNEFRNQGRVSKTNADGEDVVLVTFRSTQDAREMLPQISYVLKQNHLADFSDTQREMAILQFQSFLRKPEVIFTIDNTQAASEKLRPLSAIYPTGTARLIQELCKARGPVEAETILYDAEHGKDPLLLLFDKPETRSYLAWLRTAQVDLANASLPSAGEQFKKFHEGALAALEASLKRQMNKEIVEEFIGYIRREKPTSLDIVRMAVDDLLNGLAINERGDELDGSRYKGIPLSREYEGYISALQHFRPQTIAPSKS